MVSLMSKTQSTIVLLHFINNDLNLYMDLFINNRSNDLYLYKYFENVHSNMIIYHVINSLKEDIQSTYSNKKNTER